VLALALAVAAIGINLQNITIIAGALSVGIGFGLQNIVNNFVSGILLLVERPIKVNDWVVVGPSEGYIRRINVRATELQTFDGAAVIIPNSLLISQSVMNRTYKARRCRAEVKVGVAYGSDIEKVREILLDCAKAHPKTALWPESQILLAELGPSSLQFLLRVYLDDVDLVSIVPSDLRFAIYRQFKENAIDFPKPQ
jgi:potassium-dependent mechanosensitive channel